MVESSGPLRKPCLNLFLAFLQVLPWQIFHLSCVVAGEFICAAFQCQAWLVCSPDGTIAAWIDGFDCIEGQRCRYRGGSVASARFQWLLPLTWASIGVLERRSADQSQQCPVTAATAPPAVDLHSRASIAGHTEATLNGINRDDLEPILCQSTPHHHWEEYCLPWRTTSAAMGIKG